MSVVIASGKLLLAAYDGHPDQGRLIGTAKRDAARGTWTVTVGGTVRRRHRRRAAHRTLSRLAYAVLTDRAVAASSMPHRREGIGGGVQTFGRGA